jgi:aminoglycoside phosphotransferase (APT) family kinase protein
VIDLHRLGRWMDDQGLPGQGEPIEHRFLSGGTQNEIYEISRGELRCAMRIPPPSAPAGRDEGIGREWRIIDALTGTDVPCPRAVAVCADPSVLGRAFYLMGFVDGWSPMDQPGWPAPFDADPAARQGLAYQMAEGIALLSKVDWEARGLHDLGRPDGFHERQVDRWTAFLERIKGRELPGFDVAAAWLRAHRPLDYIPGLMHGDYQIANVMFRHGGPARLAAIVDWEMGTVGDPKLDMAWMVQSWPEEGWPEKATSAAAAFPGHADLSGMPSRSALLARYAEVSGRQVDDIDYYLILAKWKFAVVLEQGFQRAGDDVKLQAFGPVVLELMRGAAELAEITDYRSLRQWLPR